MHDPSNDYLKIILANWFTPAELSQVQIREIAGGLSGAKLWRVAVLDNDFCLRRWPRVHPTFEQLAVIHGLIAYVWNSGLKIVPLPQQTLKQHTILAAQGDLWELSRWLPGEITKYPSVEQSTAAVETLARFHSLAANYQAPQTALAPGLQNRLRILQELQSGAQARLEHAARGAAPSEIRDIATAMLLDLRAILPDALPLVQEVASEPLRLQWCLRDVHLENLLFTNNKISGLVDFGAVTIDSVAGDVARLLRSMAGEDRQAWHKFSEIYSQQRALTFPEQQAIGAYDIGGLIATTANWLRWLLIEHLDVADAVSTQARLIELAARLKALTDNTAVFSSLFRRDR